jgi:hypothetical protein
MLIGVEKPRAEPLLVTETGRFGVRLEAVEVRQSRPSGGTFRGSNVPVTYMTWLDGVGYKRWGTPGLMAR